MYSSSLLSLISIIIGTTTAFNIQSVIPVWTRMPNTNTNANTNKNTTDNRRRRRRHGKRPSFAATATTFATTTNSISIVTKSPSSTTMMMNKPALEDFIVDDGSEKEEEDEEDEEDEKSTVTTIQWMGPTTEETQSSTSGTGRGTATKATITVVGTVHVSKKSCEQVERIINDIQPTIVMIELDELRYKRIVGEGIIDDATSGTVVDESVQKQQQQSSSSSTLRIIAPGNDIPLISEFIQNDPIEQFIQNNDNNNNNNNDDDTNGVSSSNFLLSVLLKSYIYALDKLFELFFLPIVRILATAAAPKSTSTSTNSSQQEQGQQQEQQQLRRGNEFVTAINAAKDCPSCHTLILGDRSSIITYRRAALLSMFSSSTANANDNQNNSSNGSRIIISNPFTVMNKLKEVNQKERQRLQEKVRQRLVKEKMKQQQQQQQQEEHQPRDVENVTNKDDAITIDKEELEEATIEAYKAYFDDNDGNSNRSSSSSSSFLTRLSSTWENEIPTIAQAVLKERDYIMSQGIVQELVRIQNSNENDNAYKDGDGMEEQEQRVVAVVGLAHVPGIIDRLKQSSSLSS